MSALPTNRDENWRYANLRPLARARPEAVPSGAAPQLPGSVPLEGFQSWIFIDGHQVMPGAITDGGNFAERLDARNAGDAFAGLLDAEIAAAGVDFALARTNASQGNEVLNIRLPDHARASIDVAFIASAGAASGTSYPRLQVQLGRNARLNLVERHSSAGAGDAAVNAAVDISVAAGAELAHVRLQNCADQATIFDTLLANVGEGAQYRLRTVTLGGLASRSTAFIKLAGRAARCEFTAASIANGNQTHDLFAEIEHIGPASVTRELFRGIANERGKLAFNGKMIVRGSALDADSDQSLRTLLNGAGAEAAARPQLEIHTDRVRARHGATTGKLDEQMLFYLLSRGLERADAQALLQWAFIEDAVSKIEPAALRREIETLVAARLRSVATLSGLLGERP
jgi:Fe-S cluster assembly protein SufD